MKYFVKSGDKIYGPVEDHKIGRKIADGFFAQNCLISTDREEWKVQTFTQKAESVKQIRLAATQNPPPPPQQPPPPGLNDGRGPKIKMRDEPQPPPQAIKLSAADIAPAVVATPVKKRSLKWLWILLIIVGALIVLGATGAMIWVTLSGARLFKSAKIVKTGKKTKFRRSGAELPPAKNFEEACANCQRAVGLVVVTLEDSDGKLLTKIGDSPVDCFQPVGTAFAIGENQFVTNSHVAYGVKDQKRGVLELILRSFYCAMAQKNGARTEEEFAEFFKKNQKSINADRKYLQEHVRVRSVEIRLSHSNGITLPVTGVQIHPRYKENISSEDDAFKNAEFDVAILTTAKSAPVYFRRADTETLYQLAPGRRIAYLGFPMEGLENDGGLNIDKPEATFKDGTINKVTDFDNAHGEARNNKAITHSIPTVGGASGSPVFLENGEVVAVAWGASFDHDEDGNRTASAALHNFAVRIDSLDAVENEPVHDINEWLGEGK
ncbi:MAG: trypsin-like peptidase domain-containing protein [Lentisphaeria bacterium]|nr:trypsin-like peptidase domain-containing protein [Lentisphaeria bacterium]